jgi:hypothetical protein
MITRIKYSQLKGLPQKLPCKLATTNNINLLSITNQIDGISVNVGDRILVKDQIVKSENGVYIVVSVGSGSNGIWERSDDFSFNVDVFNGIQIYVTSGDENSNTVYFLSTENPINIGTSDLEFIVFESGSGLTEAEANDLYLRKIGDEFADQEIVDFSTFGGEYYGEGIVHRHYNLPDNNITYYSRTVGDSYPGYSKISEVFQDSDEIDLAVNDWSSYMIITDDGTSNPYFNLQLTDNGDYNVSAYQYQDKEYWQVAHTNNYDEKLAYIITEITGTPYYESYGQEENDYYYTYQDPAYWGIWSEYDNNRQNYSYLELGNDSPWLAYGGYGDYWSNEGYSSNFWGYHSFDYWGASQEKINSENQLEKLIYLETVLQSNYNYYELRSTDSGNADGNGYWDKSFNQYVDRWGWGTYHQSIDLNSYDGDSVLEIWTNWGLSSYGDDEFDDNQWDFFVGEDNFWSAINDWEYYQIMRNNPDAVEKGYFVNAPDQYKFTLKSYLEDTFGEVIGFDQEAITIKGGWQRSFQDPSPLLDLFPNQFPVIPSVMITSPRSNFEPSDLVYNGKPVVFIGTEDYFSERNGVHLGTTILQEDKSFGNYDDTVKMGFVSSVYTSLFSDNKDFHLIGYSDINNEDWDKVFSDDIKTPTSFFFFGDQYNRQGYYEPNPNGGYSGSGNEIYNDPTYSEQYVYSDWDNFTPRYVSEIEASDTYTWFANYIYQPNSNIYSGIYADANYNDLWMQDNSLGYTYSYSGIFNQKRTVGGQELIETVIQGNTFRWEQYSRTFDTHANADSDNTLPENAFYKIINDRTIYQKKIGDSTPDAIKTITWNSLATLVQAQTVKDGKYNVTSRPNTGTASMIVTVTNKQVDNIAVIQRIFNNKVYNHTINYTFLNDNSAYNDYILLETGTWNNVVSGYACNNFPFNNSDNVYDNDFSTADNCFFTNFTGEMYGNTVKNYSAIYATNSNVAIGENTIINNTTVNLSNTIGLSFRNNRVELPFMVFQPDISVNSKTITLNNSDYQKNFTLNIDTINGNQTPSHNWAGIIGLTSSGVLNEITSLSNLPKYIKIIPMPGVEITIDPSTSRNIKLLGLSGPITLYGINEDYIEFYNNGVNCYQHNLCTF